MAMTVRETDRGFKRADFIDADGYACSIQESSTVFKSAGPDGPFLWLGCNAGFHDEDRCLARMHLTRQRAAELLPLLLAFVETGRLP